MSFTGEENHSITLQEASQLTSNYRNNNLVSIKGFYYSKSAIQQILNQADCVGIRIYYGQDASIIPLPCLVISGVKNNEDDIETGILAEFGTPCPPHCGSLNPLNS